MIEFSEIADDRPVPTTREKLVEDILEFASMYRYRNRLIPTNPILCRIEADVLSMLNPGDSEGFWKFHQIRIEGK